MEAIKPSLMNGFQKMHSVDDVYLIFNIRRVNFVEGGMHLIESQK